MHEWVILTSRMGEGFKHPDVSTMQNVLTELFSSKRDDEHPDCWLQCGSQEGPLYSINVFQSGFAIYTKYSDVDMSEELESREIKAPDVNAALRLWEALIQEHYSDL
jgi:hypothetical protein